MSDLRLTWDLCDNLHIVARDRTAKTVFVGGLGVFGVGRMWFPEYEFHAQWPGFENAQEAKDGSNPRGPVSL